MEHHPKIVYRPTSYSSRMSWMFPGSRPNKVLRPLKGPHIMTVRARSRNTTTFFTSVRRFSERSRSAMYLSSTSSWVDPTLWFYIAHTNNVFSFSATLYWAALSANAYSHQDYENVLVKPRCECVNCLDFVTALFPLHHSSLMLIYSASPKHYTNLLFHKNIKKLGAQTNTCVFAMGVYFCLCLDIT